MMRASLSILVILIVLLAHASALADDSLSMQSDTWALKKIVSVVVHDCPKALDHTQKAEEDHAVADDAQYKEWKAAARLVYECSQAESDEYQHEWLTIAYVEDMYFSNNTNGDALNVDPMLMDTLLDVYHNTQYEDVNKAAAELRADLNEEYNKAHEAVYGNGQR